MVKPINPGPDYDAALWGVTLGIRRDRRFFGITGKAPGDMLNGLISNSPPPPLVAEEGPELKGVVAYSALLTAKGRVITDLRLFRDPEDGFLLDISAAGATGAESHFKKFLPPRLAKIRDRSDELALLTLLGPEAPPLLSKLMGPMGVQVSVQELAGLTEGHELVFPSARAGTVRLARNGDYHAEGLDVLLPSGAGEELQSGLDSAGAVPLTEATSEVLRVEKGRPRYGKDMDESTILLETGIQDRAVDNEKGCYVGQEVVIRIRDRGQVNKQLRGVLLGEAELPSSGVELFVGDREKTVGWITTAVSSPAFGQAIALAYIRRGVDVGTVVRVGSHEGPEARVRALRDSGWVLE